MSSLVKLSSLTNEEKICFIKQANGTFVLAKKMLDRPWDAGSVWKVVCDADGNKCIVRIEEDDKETVSSAFLPQNRCPKCHAMMEPVTSGRYTYDFCPKCDKEEIVAFKQASVVEEVKQSEAPTSGIGYVSASEGAEEAILRGVNDEHLDETTAGVRGEEKEGSKVSEGDARALFERLQTQSKVTGVPVSQILAMRKLSNRKMVRSACGFTVEVVEQNGKPVIQISDDLEGKQCEVSPEECPVSVEDLKDCSEPAFTQYCTDMLNSDYDPDFTDRDDI